ncbi:uncharacterized protein LOC127594452 [Hippocampus zosterae]|uniref:uncharacterized protein LOC127594452 n=1 Tax=Hippocampus zosterae TaxID=109293 RepID=UPI00223E54D1|nr:uncharacterized protein LOC127594452 [Hippocampus zosterae]
MGLQRGHGCGPGSVVALHSFTKVELLEGLLSYAGYEEIKPEGATDAGMFYTYFPRLGETLETPKPDSPVVIWMNGGPGSSSQIGSWTEIGPVECVNGTDGKQALKPREPVTGVGLSFTVPNNLTVNSTITAGKHFVQFFTQLFEGSLAPLKSNPLYIVGESFGGHYAPYFTWLLARQGVRISGMMIVDGWSYPEVQSQYYAAFLRSWGVAAGATVDRVLGQQANVALTIRQGNLEAASGLFDEVTGDNYPGEGRDPFEIWMNNNKKALGAPDFANFSSGNEIIYNAFKQDIPRSYADYVAEVAGQMPVLVINGQLDYIVNTEGVINELELKGLIDGQGGPWRLDGQMAGRVYKGKLTLAVVNLAGHTVPEYQPGPARDAIRHLLSNSSDWDN